MLHTHLAALVLTATTIAMAGCGGSSKSGQATTSATTTTPTTSSTATTATTGTGATTNAGSTATLPAVKVQIASGKPLTKAQWISQGDAICARLSKELKAVSVKVSGELPRVLPRAAAYERAAAIEFAKLVPPTSRASDWQQYVNETLQWAEGTTKVAETAKLGDAITETPLVRATTATYEHLLKLAKHDGFKVCSIR